MKRCPECRRDYHDDSLLYCLEDGTALVQGSVPSPDEPQTAILYETDTPSEAATKAQIHTTGIPSAGETRSSWTRGISLKLIGTVVIVAILLVG